MSQRQQWITLESCIYDYISEAELTENKYAKLFNIAFRAMEELGLDFFYQIKSVLLDVKPNKVADLPEDYANYTKLGILNGSGGVIALKFNGSLTSFADLNVDRLANIGNDSIASIYSFTSPNFYNFGNGDGYSTLYGVANSGLYGGGFKIDNSNNVVILDPSFGYSKLLLEYTANPPNDKDYMIPQQFREAIIAYLAWRDIVNLPIRRGSIGTNQQRRLEYFEARRRGIAKYKPFHVEQFVMASQDSSRLVVKS